MPAANSRRLIAAVAGLLFLGVAAIAAYRIILHAGHAESSASGAPAADSYAYNDTGVTFCANQTDYTRDCSPAGLGALQGLGQDGETGADAVVPGKPGFSFTKIDAQGNALPDSAPAWTCVRDNTTGLLWEHKNGQGLHGLGMFSWFNPDTVTNGGAAGYESPADAMAARGNSEFENTQRLCDSSLPKCNSRAFTEAVNHENYCGRHDWRLPDIDELTDLGNFDVLENQPHDRYFKDMIGFNVLSRTSIPVTPDEMAESEEARHGFFWTTSGNINAEKETPKTALLPIRLVSDHDRKPVVRAEKTR